MDGRQKRELIARCAGVYFRIFFERFRRYPLPMHLSRQLETRGTGKYANVFGKVVDFLLEERRQANGADSLNRPFQDYFLLMFNHYSKFGRVPTITQISPGSVNSSNFINMVLKEEQSGHGKYWSTKDSLDKAYLLNKYGSNIEYDPILPHTYTGPGDPTNVPELNKGVMPLTLNFEQLLKYGLINPSQQDIDIWNRLFKQQEYIERLTL
jgi:hypothetical protein